MKKGIFVKILNNQLRVFLPFSNANFINEWGKQIKIDPTKYRSIQEFLDQITIASGYRPNPRKQANTDTFGWYANNCLVRYEYPLSEGCTNTSIIKNMLEELCATREVPDIEFFINRRDFPLLTTDGTEPYNHMWGKSDLPLISHAHEKYSPILSLSKSDKYADVLYPTWDDWIRIQSQEGKMVSHKL